MQKGNLFITLLIVSSLAGNAQNKSNILLGRWKIVKTISTDARYYLNKEESKQFVGDVVIFRSDRIIAPQNKTFYGGCSSPIYKIKNVDAIKYYHNNREYLKLVGCKTTNIEIVETSCGLPFSSIHIIDKNNIDMGVDSYRYFLKRVKKEN